MEAKYNAGLSKERRTGTENVSDEVRSGEKMMRQTKLKSQRAMII